MKKINHYKNKAFSLIELSIVILIIGVVITGITQSSRLIRQFTLKNAQNLTTNSPLNTMRDLVLWLETSSPGYIYDANFNSELEDGDSIEQWHDRKINTSSRLIFTAPSLSKSPNYIEEGINNLPTIRFDRSTPKYFENNDGFLEEGDDTYTIIAVYQAHSNLSGDNYVIGQSRSTSPCLGGSLVSLYVRGSSGPGYDGCSTSHRAAQATLSGQVFVTALTGDGTTITVYPNSLTGNSNTRTNNGPDGTRVRVGQYTVSEAGGLDADISEIIAFDRVIRDYEMVEIMTYISKKYDVEIAGL